MLRFGLYADGAVKHKMQLVLERKHGQGEKFSRIRAMQLVDGLPSNLDADVQMVQIAQWLRPEDYDAIVEERNIEHKCGFIKCGAKLTRSPLFDQDVQNIRNFCSRRCFDGSIAFKQSLSADSISVNANALKKGKDELKFAEEKKDIVIDSGVKVPVASHGVQKSKFSLKNIEERSTSSETGATKPKLREEVVKSKYKSRALEGKSMKTPLPTIPETSEENDGVDEDEEREEFSCIGEGLEKAELEGENWLPSVDFDEIRGSRKEMRRVLNPFTLVMQFTYTLGFPLDNSPFPDEVLYSEIQLQRREIVLKNCRQHSLAIMSQIKLNPDETPLILKRMNECIKVILFRESIPAFKAEEWNLFFLAFIESICSLYKYKFPASSSPDLLRVLSEIGFSIDHLVTLYMRIRNQLN